MTKAHVLKSFRLAGFPLRKLGSCRYEYYSSVIRVLYVGHELPIRVYYKQLSEFEIPSKAIAYIQRVLSIQLVTVNDFALNTGPRGDLRLVEVAS